MAPFFESVTGFGVGVVISAPILLAPQSVILAATVAGLLGREGEVVRAALPPVVSVLILGVLGMILS